MSCTCSLIIDIIGRISKKNILFIITTKEEVEMTCESKNVSKSQERVNGEKRRVGDGKFTNARTMMIVS